MISEETDKGNDLSANNIIPQGQNILCAFHAQIAMALWTGSIRLFEATKNIV